MATIKVGRDNPKEVSIGIPVSHVAQEKTGNAETEEKLAQAPVENEQVVAPEEGGVPEEKAAPVKGRGKKRGKA